MFDLDNHVWMTAEGRHSLPNEAQATFKASTHAVNPKLVGMTHGLLGQTVRATTYKSADPDPNMQYIEGSLKDYELSDLFADDFRFNQYARF